MPAVAEKSPGFAKGENNGKYSCLRALAVALGLGALGTWAQQVTPATSHESIAAQVTSAGEVNSDHPVLEQRNPRYRIQPQDALSISFPISPEFDQKVVVQPDGYINLHAAGAFTWKA